LSTVVEMTAGRNEIADQGETADFQRSLPMKRMGAGAVIRDADGNVLIVKPTYTSGWELPGGAVEDDESPAQACTREIREELGVDLAVGALMCVDYNSSTSGYVESLMFLFDIESLDTGTVSEIRLNENELSECRFVSVNEATELLDARVARRLNAALRPEASSVYLEDQHPFDEVIDRQRLTIAHVEELAERGLEPQATWVRDGTLDESRRLATWVEENRGLFT
jgi:ADP-ribose pyrophosphatase YjhB (NUDIX family)